MNSWFLISYVTLWILLVMLFLIVLAAVRQIGLIHRRIAPAYGARMGAPGPALGEIAPPLAVRDLKGNPVTLGHLERRKTLLVFLSTSCSACDEVAPALRSVAHNERRAIKTILVSDGSADEAASFMAKHRLGHIPMIVSHAVQDQYDVQASPFALLIDESGRVQTKGIVNSFEHLESLMRAHELQVDSIESFIDRVQGQKPSSSLAGGYSDE